MRRPLTVLAMLAVLTTLTIFGSSSETHLLAQAPQVSTPPCASTGHPSDSASRPCTSPTTPAPSVTKAPTVSQRFPYPGSESPANDPPSPAGKSAADAPSPVTSAPSPAANAPVSPRSAFPYPGDPDATSSSSSSSSSSSAGINSAVPLPSLDDVGSEGTNTRRKLPKVTKLQNDEDRAYEDLTVAKFYQDKGNLDAAYLRNRDAVKAQPQLPDAHLALAQIADKLQKKDEAIAEYDTYLKLEPDGGGSKAARKALDRLK